MSYIERRIKTWDNTLPHLYKVQPGRAGMISGVMLHSTRSGHRDGDDGPRTEGWWGNPSNNQGGWGSYGDILIFEDGTRVICTAWDAGEHATWTSGYGDAGTWAAGIYYIQIEIAQGTIDEPFTDAAIDSLAFKVAELAKQYNFPITRIPFLTQTGTPPRGICTHEDSANGRKTGKTDPGHMFPWDTFMAKAKNYLNPPPEDGMPTEQEIKAWIDAAIDVQIRQPLEGGKFVWQQKIVRNMKEAGAWLRKEL